MEVLRRVPFFGRLSTEELEGVDARAVARGYGEGTAIYRAGTPARSLYILASGRVKITRPRPGGGDVVVDMVLPGEHFGALPSLGQQTYEDTAEALTVSCALAISPEDLDQILRTYPQVALELIPMLAQRLAEARRVITRLSGDSVERRLAGTLLALADRAGHVQREGTLLQLPLTRADLAGMSGATTESVSRTLSRWRRLGIIDSGRRWVAIRDRTAIEARAGAVQQGSAPAATGEPG
ncbi:Crp/Fnr family transcriptional regulator [Micromonospora sonneratiae]|uniref:Crp/Fnr family transcriptional regulator n=1 Tax=Micromonospora sonneratiae TaxID=1184706 RepID=A0ABW3YG31_9ACTN